MTVMALTDAVFDGTEFFEAVLSNPSAGVQIGQSTASVFITDQNGKMSTYVCMYVCMYDGCMYV